MKVYNDTFAVFTIESWYKNFGTTYIFKKP